MGVFARLLAILIAAVLKRCSKKPTPKPIPKPSKEFLKQKPSSTIKCSPTCSPATKEEILKGAKPGKVSSARQYHKQGGFKQANKDFDALTRGSRTRDRPGGVRTTELPDGSKVDVRPSSKGGQPTLEIQPLLGKRIKIRYE